ncbi:globin [Epibacterium sp. MM17-32]|uniref:globin n=1 Tax=Epibacterium sp. MM17-32 TaxID=2917734 RepID=UPI001EF67049|nr:globin [Epibacterium sp. MM17-32]MCG7628640.1 globin [Epibacterium sp. MM17-32]
MAILHEIDARLVRGSIGKVFARKAALTDRFYDYLFLELPETRDLFTQDFSHQKEMFAQVLVSGVKSLGQEGQLAALVERILLQHQHLGLTAMHMYVAQRALLLAFDEVLRDDLTAAEASAWNDALRRVCQSLAAGIESTAT